MSDTRISLAEAAARMEILALFARYCRAVDTNDYSLFTDVFTEEIEADYTSVGVYDNDRELVFHRRDDLVTWFNKTMAGIGEGLTHFMTNHLIEMDGDQATVTVYNHVLNVAMGGVYHCRAVSTPEGWRLSSLRFEVRYFADMIARLNHEMTTTEGRTV
jgi:SnoaL-like domain